MNICVQAGRESQGIVSPFSPASVCNLVCMSCCKMIYAHVEAVGQRDLRSTVDLLYRDMIPNIGGSDFELTLINLSELCYVFFLSILTKKVALKLVRFISTNF